MKELRLEDDASMSLREAVYQTLRRAILTDVLKPGERLMEMKLAAQLGVSRTPVREAIHLLEKESLVIQMPRQGVVVAQITPKQLRDVLEVRSMLEELAVQLACRRATGEDLKELEKAEADFAAAVHGNAPVTELAEKDVAFHDVIYQMTENDKLVQLVANLWEQIYRYRIEYLKDVKVRAGLVEEHRQLLGALCARNAEEAVRLARLHIANQELTIARQLEEEKK